MLSFALPSPLNANSAPEWTGHDFRVDGQLLPVLEYSENFAGWSDEMTLMHDEDKGTHPISIASRSDAVKQLKTYLRTPNPVILEIGCSSGFFLQEMRQALPKATIIGTDVVREPLYKLAKELPSIPLLRFDITKCPLPSNTFDAIVILNVLEHIEDDVTALAQIYRILKPGGIIVIEVPAGAHLYDAFDKGLMHFRRYGSAELINKLQDAGFQVVRRSHLGFFLYPAFAMAKRRNQHKIIPPGDLNAFVQIQSEKTSASLIFRSLIAIERIVGKWISYPIGIRCMAVGKKVA